MHTIQPARLKPGVHSGDLGQSGENAPQGFANPALTVPAVKFAVGA